MTQPETLCGYCGHPIYGHTAHWYDETGASACDLAPKGVHEP